MLKKRQYGVGVLRLALPLQKKSLQSIFLQILHENNVKTLVYRLLKTNTFTPKPIWNISRRSKGEICAIIAELDASLAPSNAIIIIIIALIIALIIIALVTIFTVILINAPCNDVMLGKFGMN